ncbi:MAG: serine/threonine protein kinase [Polyangiaceae bacterium]|nr:serine/threonine protein kinase [Polyangiaceae bacterium]
MSDSTNSTLQPGDVLLGKYRVERVLGQGGMGMVVAARHQQLGELFAIKVMLPEVLEHPEALERFLREARASARLRGEHVARVHDVGTLESGAPYMVLEYLEGTDLDNVISSRGALGIGEAASYVYQACEALLEAHALGIVHRDLKPPNLFMIRRPNGTPCIKVLDFGISKELGGDAINPKLTKTGTIMGSPLYMSPEQMLDAKDADTRSDIWSLGVILYELATGKLPFIAENMTEIVAKVLSTQPLPPSQVCPGMSPAFDVLVGRCLDKNRDTRFQTVQEFMAALRPFVNEKDVAGAGAARDGSSSMAQSAVGWGQETLAAGSHVVGNRTGRFSNRTWIAASALAAAVLLGGIAFVATRPAANELTTPPVPTLNSAAMADSAIPSAVASAPPAASASADAAPPTIPAKTTATPAVQTPVVKATVSAAPASSTTKTKKVKGFND